MIVIKRSKDLALHLITGLAGMLIFLYLAGHHEVLTGFAVWTGIMVGYHFVVRFFFFNILYSRGKHRGLYNPLRGKWVRIDATPKEELR